MFSSSSSSGNIIDWKVVQTTNDWLYMWIEWYNIYNLYIFLLKKLSEKSSYNQEGAGNIILCWI